jgi:NADH:ubiquinone oxidoreductase subunit D
MFYERASGARMHANYFRVGGVHRDLPLKNPPRPRARVRKARLSGLLVHFEPPGVGVLKHITQIGDLVGRHRLGRALK